MIPELAALLVADYVSEAVQRIRRQVGEEEVILGLSMPD